ncbi:MAG: acyl carrier protein [Victivallales bacterium]|nr:acyl carrier protein [Victivallales bacterium]
MEDIRKQIKELLVERLFLDIEPQSIEDEKPLAEYGVDSFLLLEMIVAMEEQFGVTFEQSEITAEVLKSVGSLARLVEGKLNG